MANEEKLGIVFKTGDNELLMPVPSWFTPAMIDALVPFVGDAFEKLYNLAYFKGASDFDNKAGAFSRPVNVTSN